MILGLRCSNSDYHFALLEGTKKAPVIKKCERVQFPEGFKKPAALKWMVDEIKDKLTQVKAEKVVMKGPEPMARPTAELRERIEFEAAVYIACAETGLKAVFKKVKATIAKDLGVKGRARYLQTLDTRHITGFEALSDKAKEAVLAAWTELD